MRVINPESKDHVFSSLDDCKNAIFLAGPCPRDPDDMENTWQDDAIKFLEKIGFNGVILNPVNKYYDETDKDHLKKQTAWEVEAMHKASAIVFWIERSEKHPALTTNIEFGQWHDKEGVFVGSTDAAIKNNYLKERIAAVGKTWYTTLYSLLVATVNFLNRPSKKVFLSDTHFSQQRTLELSKRPFRNVREMDLTMISNWNKSIKMSDEVYFLGDFGSDFNYLKFLNFKILHFVFGNYERQDADKNDILSETIEKLERLKKQGLNIKYYNRGECKLKLSNGKSIVLVHEPVDPETTMKDGKVHDDVLYVYGHIHCRTIYKLNGTDVGVDGNFFKPVFEDQLIWRLNAIQYLDDNVWTDKCKEKE